MLCSCRLLRQPESSLSRKHTPRPPPSPPQAAALALKYPTVLTRPTAAVAFMAARLRALCGRRGRWAEDAAAGLPPGIMAFYMRDFGDLVSFWA